MTVPLSVVIPSHNRPDLLHICLHSVHRTPRDGTQVIVVDDGSPDGVVSAAAGAFPGVTVLRNDRPAGVRGRGQPRNHGGHRGRDRVAQRRHRGRPGWAAAAFGAVRRPDGRGRRPAGAPRAAGAGRADHRQRRRRVRSRRLRPQARPRPAARPTDFREPCEVFGASARPPFYRADVLRAVGGLSGRLRGVLRGRRSRLRIRNAGSAACTSRHRSSGTGSVSSYRRRRALVESQSRNEERVYWRNVPDLWRTLPRHAAVLAAKAVWRVREGTIIPWAMGRLRALAEVSAVMRSRALTPGRPRTRSGA